VESKSTFGLHHFSFTVSDLERTISFYVSLLGFRLRSREIFEWDDEYSRSLLRWVPSKAFDAPAKVEVAALELNGFRVEFEQWLSPETVPSLGDPSVAGASHLAVKVRDIDQVCRRLSEAGVEFSQPAFDLIESGNRPWRYCYFWDPDRIIVELVQEMPITSLVKTVGVRLREARQSRGLTLKEVAGRVHISVPRLSQMESGTTMPSITNLIQIASVLDVLPDFFLRLEESELELPWVTNGSAQGGVSTGDMRVQPAEHGGGMRVSGALEWQRVTNPSEPVQVVRYIFQVGSSAHDDGLNAPGREQILVLEGMIQAECGEMTQVLGAGGSASFDRSLPRRFANVGTIPAVVLRIVNGDSGSHQG